MIHPVHIVKFLVETILTIAIKAAIKMLNQKECQNIIKCILKDSTKDSENDIAE